ncbi:MAG: hypothetical protein BWK80_08130 [Desulfobacteraceae bacterium IS3]|nr:MAG: hypothetical protein BWK80_08130 [Desulfobacteraceae bacterium IS3]HAO19791.1 hypothetical protein [Desulfobacteraceae bacterium]
MARRQISEEDIAEVIANPEQTEMVRSGLAVYQSRFKTGNPPKTYLIRVFLDIDRYPPDVVTVYRTSKVEKYWRTEK